MERIHLLKKLNVSSLRIFILGLLAFTSINIFSQELYVGDKSFEEAVSDAMYVRILTCYLSSGQVNLRIDYGQEQGNGLRLKDYILGPNKKRYKFPSLANVLNTMYELGWELQPISRSTQNRLIFKRRESLPN